MIQVDHLVYDYPGRRALHDLSFHVPRGSVTALVGPNGAGKTTLLRCLAALTRPFSGSIRIRELDIIKNPRKSHTFLGFLPDFFGLYDALTVRQTLSYFAQAQLLPHEKIQDRVESLTEVLDLGDRLDDRAGSLSRGMRQRLAIGVAMIHEPDVLLLDEPASGLDPEARHSLAQLFTDLSRKGKTLVVSSHILSELDQYASNMIILKEGRIVEQIRSETAPARVRIEMVSIPEGFESILENAGAKPLFFKDQTAWVEIPDDDQTLCELLKTLLEEQIQVKGFIKEREGIQEAYLKTVAARDNGERMDT